MDRKILELVVCPVCKGPLEYAAKQDELICQFDKLAFPIRDEIPVMIVERARPVVRESQSQ